LLRVDVDFGLTPSGLSSPETFRCIITGYSSLCAPQVTTQVENCSRGKGRTEQDCDGNDSDERERSLGISNDSNSPPTRQGMVLSKEEL
jgi:hypothetical protein